MAKFVKKAIAPKVIQYLDEIGSDDNLLAVHNVRAIIRLQFDALVEAAYSLDKEKRYSANRRKNIANGPGITAQANLALNEVASFDSIENAATDISNEQLYNMLVEEIRGLKGQVVQNTKTLEGFTGGSSRSEISRNVDKYDTKIKGWENTNEAQASHSFELSTQFNSFLNELSRSVKSVTRSGYSDKFKFLFTIIPRTLDCREFDKSHMQEIKSALLNKNTTRGIKNEKKALNAKTINGYLSHYRSFFSWLVKHVDGVNDNPFTNVSIKVNQLENVNRRALSNDEVQKILNYKVQHPLEAKTFRDDAYWFLPIALYTGMRLNEISELRLDDIKIVDGIWCFDLGGHNTKNITSRRLVPISQQLLNLDLLAYIYKLKERGRTFLFYQIRLGKKTPGRSGWGEPISRWFNRSVTKVIGISKEAERKNKTTVVFHCFRHTMIRACIEKGAQKHLVKRIVGHSQDDQITLGVYSDVDKISLKALKGVLDCNLNWLI